MSLPIPEGRQREVLRLPAEGHTVVLGTAGSGKTTLAILRAAYLADQTTDHSGRTLLVTFNRALVAYLKHMQEQELPGVVVENYHKFARGYLGQHGRLGWNQICEGDLRTNLISRALEAVKARYDEHPFFSRPIDLFCEETKWIAQHGIQTAQDYQEAERIGRAGTRIVRNLRDLMFEIYEEYLRLRASEGKRFDWDDLATAVIEEFGNDTSERRYKHIVIDEGQDFSPEMIRSLVMAVPDDGSVTFFGDVAQQIYGHRMSWRDAGLVIPKVWQFKENYRNSRQIADLALAISDMPYFKHDPDIVAPTAPKADGPLPTIVKCQSILDEARFVAIQAANASRVGSVVVLVRKRENERPFANFLPSESIRLDHDLDTWTAGPGVRYGTYHSAKGLEFDTVIMPFCGSDRFPDPEQVDIFGDEEAEAKDGGLLYVGVTRARSRLIITYSGELTNLLPSDLRLFERLES